MQYSKEYPTQEGWYWVKRATERGGEIMYAEYYEDGFANYPPGYYFLSDDFPIKLKSNVEWLFAGPLQEPS